MKTISIFLALINSLLAGVLIVFLLSSVDFQVSMKWWSVLRILLALSVIVTGVLAWISEIAPIRPELLIVGSLFLVAIGPATIVWAFHRATLTGHLEFHMLMYGMSLFVQGFALLFGISPEKVDISAAPTGR